MGIYDLAGYSSKSGSFTQGTVPSGYKLVANASQLDLQHLADQNPGFSSPTATFSIVTGGTKTVSATLTNNAPASSAALNVSLANNGGSGGTVSGLSSSSGGTLAAQGTLTVSGTFTAGTVGLNETWSIVNTDNSAATTTATATGTVNVYNHAAGVLSLTSNATVNAIAGQVITPTFTFTNSGANNDNLSIQGNSNFTAGASSGTLTAGQSASGLTAASITAPAAGGNASKSYSVTWLEDQTVIGATAGNQTTPVQTVTVDAYSHAAGVLSLTSNATVNAIAGQVITPTFTFTNSGANNDKLSIQGNSNFSAGASSGTLTAGQSASGLTAASITAPAAGSNANKSYSITWLEDQTVIGATAGNQTTPRRP